MPGLIRGVARTAVVAGTATAVSGRVSRRQQGKWARQEQEAQAQQAPYAAPAPAPVAPVPAPMAAPVAADDMDSKIEQLKKLAELKDAGVLTEDEFATQKAKILG